MKKLREAFGISQEQFASFLNVSRSQVALAETRERTYQGHALLKISKLLVLLKNRIVQPVVTHANDQQAALLNKALQERIDECKFQLILVNRKMEAMKRKFEECCNAYQLVNELRANPDPDNVERENKLVEWIEISVPIKLRKCGLQAQELLQLQIDVLEFEAAQALKKMVLQ